MPCAGELAGKTPAAMETVEGPPAGFGNVLLVEDEDTLRIATGKALQKRGFSVLSVGDGQAALDLFEARAQEISAVVLDLTLPVISGLDVLPRIREIAPGCRIVLTSAYDRDSAGSSAAFDQVGVAFLRKPYRISDLVLLLGQAATAAPRSRVVHQGD
jgi:CheY-like chemotaxis protein